MRGFLNHHVCLLRRGEELGEHGSHVHISRREIRSLIEGGFVEWVRLPRAKHSGVLRLSKSSGQLLPAWCTRLFPERKVSGGLASLGKRR